VLERVRHTDRVRLNADSPREVVSVSAHPRIRSAVPALAATALIAAPAIADAKPKLEPQPAPAPSPTQGATPCSILTPGVQPGVISTVGHYTIAASGNGTLVCHGSVPEGPRRTIVIKGLRCPTPAGVTWKSHTVITRSGTVNLTCHFKALHS
jgi:hypothetical protein